jgi:hypothetical protein
MAAWNSPSPQEKGGRMMARLMRAVARFEEHWLADLLGGLSLFALIPCLFFLGSVLGFK